MSSSFIPKQGNWHWYDNNSATDTSLNQLGTENGSSTGLRTNEIYWMRVTVAETGGKAGSGAVSLEYSTDNTNFTAFGTANAFNYAVGLQSEANLITTNLCTTLS